MHTVRFLFTLFAVTTVFSVSAQSRKTPPGKAIQITVDSTRTYQTITGIGGNYCQATYTDHAQDAVGEYTLKHLQPKYVRFPIPVKKWEPENDNADPKAANAAGFMDGGVTHELFVLLKDMKEKHGVVNLAAAVWDVPDWMVSNPDSAQQRVVPAEKYPELLESLTAFLLRARDQYGVTVDYFSFNEADGGYQLLFPPKDIIAFIRLAGPEWEALGLPTKFLTGDVHRTTALVDYATPLLQEPSIRKYVGPVSYHSWWSEEMPDAEFVKIRDLAQQYNLPVWCAEVGYDAFLWKKKGAAASWDNAWRCANIMQRLFKYSGASVTHYWTYQDNYPLVSEDGKPYPVFEVNKLFVDFLPAGSQIIEATASDTAVRALAAKRPDGHRMTQLINLSDTPETVVLKGLPRQPLHHWQLRENQSLRRINSLQPAASVTLTLPPKSIHVLTTKGE